MDVDNGRDLPMLLVWSYAAAQLRGLATEVSREIGNLSSIECDVQHADRHRLCVMCCLDISVLETEQMQRRQLTLF